MREPRALLCFFALLLGNAINIAEILTYGNDVTIDVLGALITFGLAAAAFKGPQWVRWLAGAVFSFAAIGGIIGAVETEGVLYVFLAICFGSAGWVMFTIKKESPDDAIVAKYSPLEQGLVSATEDNPESVRTAYPYLSARVKSFFIDQFLLLIVLIIVMVVTQGWEQSTPIKITVALLLHLLYEPVLTVYSATVGQRVMSIRVRSVSNPAKKINLFQSLLRYLTKGFLGWISFLTIHSNKERRAIHDLLTGSIMVEKSEADSLVK